MSFRAIGFDWGGVLNGKPSRYFGHDVAKLLQISYEEYLEAYFKHNKKINRGEITWPELWDLVLSDLGQPEKSNEVLQLSIAANSESLNQDVLRTVDILKSNGYKVGLLSNNTTERAMQLRESGLDKHFDVFHISEETSFVKPEQKAFSYFCEELGVNTEELIFIDDSPKSLSTSSEIGYTPILFDNNQQLIEALDNLGIRV